MTTLVASLLIAVIAGILCFIVEKADFIPLHIDRHHEPFLAGLTGGAAAFFATLIVLMLTHIPL